MIDRIVEMLKRWLSRAWLWITFVIGLAPVAWLERATIRSEFSMPDPTVESYWIERDPRHGALDVWSDDRMITLLSGRSLVRDHLHCLRSRNARRRWTGALALGLLRPLRAFSPKEDQAHLDPSIYAMY